MVAIRGLWEFVSAGEGGELIAEELVVESNTARSLGRMSQSKNRLPAKEKLRRCAGVLELLEDEGAQEDLAAGVQAPLGFGGAVERGEFGFQLGALGPPAPHVSRKAGKRCGRRRKNRRKTRDSIGRCSPALIALRNRACFDVWRVVMASYHINISVGAKGAAPEHAQYIERGPEQFFKRYNAKNPERDGARKFSYGAESGGGARL